MQNAQSLNKKLYLDSTKEKINTNEFIKRLRTNVAIFVFDNMFDDMNKEVELQKIFMNNCSPGQVCKWDFSVKFLNYEIQDVDVANFRRISNWISYLSTNPDMFIE